MFELVVWLWLAVGLHSLFVILEMWPFGTPVLLRVVMSKWHVNISDPKAVQLVSTIVRNAGAYNVIITAGFIWCLFPGMCKFLPADPESVKAISAFFFSGAVFAGLFGVTLSPVTLVQAAVGAGGLYSLWCK